MGIADLDSRSFICPLRNKFKRYCVSTCQETEPGCDKLKLMIELYGIGKEGIEYPCPNNINFKCSYRTKNCNDRANSCVILEIIRENTERLKVLTKSCPNCGNLADGFTRVIKDTVMVEMGYDNIRLCFSPLEEDKQREFQCRKCGTLVPDDVVEVINYVRELDLLTS